MVKDQQVKRLWQALSSGKTLAQSADSGWAHVMLRA